MKNMYKMMLLAVGLLVGTATLNAQNRYTFGDGETRSTTIVASENIEVTQIDDKMIQCSTVNKPMTDIRENAVTHTLTINTGRSKSINEIFVAGENYYNMVLNSFSQEVEEGYYDILIHGFFEDENGQDCTGFLTYDSVAVFQDVTINASYDECIYTIGIDAVDENGQHLSEIANLSNLYGFSFRWLDGAKWQEPFDITEVWMKNYCPEEIPWRFNGFDERTLVWATVDLHTSDQVVYSINFPIVGLSDNVIVTNNASDFISYQEKCHINENNLFYYLNSLTRFDEHTFVRFTVFDEAVTFNTDSPITIISNNKITDIYDYSYCPKRLLLPTVYETHGSEKGIISPGIYFNTDNQVVHEAFGKPWDLVGCELGNLTNYLLNFFETPATIISNPQETLSMEGRTPLTYYQAYALKAYESPSGKNTFIPRFFSIGDNSFDRVCDKDAIAIITYDGEEIYNDNLNNWFVYQQYQSENAGLVTIDIYNTHLNIDNVEKFNQTHIEFDFNREDVTTPTMTILQVKDNNGKECVEIPTNSLEQSYIKFAAGDFSPHYTEEGGYGHYDYMQYDCKPNIQVYCSLEDEGEIYWMSLFFEEDQAMFHENYGNYFSIPLDQLAGMYNNDWVSLKFILTDDAGNKMEQVLYNVFYVGNWDSLNEQTTLSHTVYPNPFTSEVKITAAQAVEGEANIAVYNVLGEQIYSKTYNCAETKEFIIDGSTWKPGVYFYSISTKDGLLQGKIIKE